MKKKIPPLNWIRSFEAAARHLSFTHAASELNLTQAAISQQIKGLENQLGSVLFNRLPRGLELTNAGAAYLPAVHDSVEKLRIATEELFGHGRTNLLTIKVNLVFFTCWLAPKLHRFRALHPDINLRITSNIWCDYDENSADSDLDVRYGKGKWQALQADRLTWDELIPVCSPDYLKHNPPLTTPQDLAKHSLLHVIGYEEGWGHWLSKTENQDVRISTGIQFDTLVTALEMAALGEGIALGRTSLVDNMLKSGRLVAPLEKTVATDEAFYLVYTTAKLISPEVKAFRDWLLQEITPT
jgi:LysR family glycine cleavage system transcriptional activator